MQQETNTLFNLDRKWTRIDSYSYGAFMMLVIACIALVILTLHDYLTLIGAGIVVLSAIAACLHFVLIPISKHHTQVIAFHKRAQANHELDLAARRARHSIISQGVSRQL